MVCVIQIWIQIWPKEWKQASKGEIITDVKVLSKQSAVNGKSPKAVRLGFFSLLITYPCEMDLN